MTPAMQSALAAVGRMSAHAAPTATRSLPQWTRDCLQELLDEVEKSFISTERPAPFLQAIQNAKNCLDRTKAVLQ